jgi:hypothetical protein
MVSRRLINYVIWLDGKFMIWWSDLAKWVLVAMPRGRCLGNRSSNYMVTSSQSLWYVLVLDLIVKTFLNGLKLLPMTTTTAIFYLSYGYFLVCHAAVCCYWSLFFFLQIKSYYGVSRNLLIKFKDDVIDETPTLAQVLGSEAAISSMLDMSIRLLPGDHGLPLQQVTLN